MHGRRTPGSLARDLTTQRKPYLLLARRSGGYAAGTTLRITQLFLPLGRS
jgi:hypothetical protein